ncbi:SIR2 family protein [Pelotalea chapellei]|uniref:SIR2 family protein n=1 Tax=Pelotalea chapellei TaxID=44671 RepID=A0ABS5U4U5_9BACT|nr:SIR2 family protein [Pelotalea chapellei]MBT1070700.1 SIR2 family protein [Pelotalea chapellei]
MRQRRYTRNQSQPFTATSDRVIPLGDGLAAIPERLLLAHARGEVLFIAGAGVSKPAGLPDFRKLVLDVYAQLDSAVHLVIDKIPHDAHNQWQPNLSGLNHQQCAEVRRFVRKDFDVVLGMLERRMDDVPHARSRVRTAIANELRKKGVKPAPIHRALMQLADRGGALTIATTNFDFLLEETSRKSNPKVQSYAHGGIPRPSRKEDFAGVLHIHGSLAPDPARISDLIVTDRDFGEYYLRRRVVPDFIYDAARLFNIVLVGYSANDPPMRYLLNAVAADGTRFDDLKERFAFVAWDSEPDHVELQDWYGRGITPIPYSDAKSHAALCRTLERWAILSAHNVNKVRIDAVFKRIVRNSRKSVNDSERDLVDHLARRADNNERVRLAKLASQSGADMEWLDAIMSIINENSTEPHQ